MSSAAVVIGAIKVKQFLDFQGHLLFPIEVCYRLSSGPKIPKKILICLGLPKIPKKTLKMGQIPKKALIF